MATSKQLKRKRHKEGHRKNQALRAAERNAELAERAAQVAADLAEVDAFFEAPTAEETFCYHPMTDALCRRPPDHDGRHSKTRLKKDG